MRLRWFLSMTLIVALTAALTVVVSQRLEGGEADEQVVGAQDGTVPPDSSATTTGSDPSTPAAGRVGVTGTVTAVHLEGAVVDPREVPTPFTVTSERGFGNGGEITGVLIDGKEQTIVWDGGRPFVLSSGGAMVLDPVTIDLAPEGLRVALSSGVHVFTPGTYQLDTPVAVGSSGVAGARESVAFETTDHTTFEPRGDAALFLDATTASHLLGPGIVHLEGTLEVTDEDGVTSVTTLDAVIGAYDITLTPVAGQGWTISAALQGKTTTS